jgi:leucyl-tRNA synthetase
VALRIGLCESLFEGVKLFHQGIILGEDGEKMSKSRGNVVSPDTIIASHGTDTLRLYLMFLGPLEAMKPWSMQQIEGVHRFLHKIWRECLTAEGAINPRIIADPAFADSPEFTKLLHETIKKVGDDIEGLRFNTAISSMMIFANALQKAPQVSRAAVRTFLQLLAPFAPHLAEELYARLGGKQSIQHEPWPTYDAARLVTTDVKLVFQVNGKHRGDQLVPIGLAQDAAVVGEMCVPPPVALARGLFERAVDARGAEGAVHAAGVPGVRRGVVATHPVRPRTGEVLQRKGEEMANQLCVAARGGAQYSTTGKHPPNT